MKQVLLLIVLLLTLWPMQALTAAEECPPADETISPDFTYTAPEGNPNIEPLVPQITDYLNSGGPPESLVSYFTDMERDKGLSLLYMNSSARAVDMDADGSDELLIGISAVHNVLWGGELLLYGCVDDAYTLLDQAHIEGWTQIEMGGFNVFEIANYIHDSDDNRPEIYIERFDTTQGRYYQILTWDGASLIPVMWNTNDTDALLPEIFGHDLDMIDPDNDWDFEAYVYFRNDGRGLREFAYYDIYQNHDGVFDFRCQVYLGDENFLVKPTATEQFLIETVEEADSYFRCGYDDAAEPLFRQILEDDSLLEAPVWNDSEPFERENLRAFSLYRLVLLNFRRGDLVAAADTYAQLGAQFPVEVPGSNYTSMAEAFWLEYEQSADWNAACDVLAAHIEPTINAILDDETRWANALYLSSIAGYPGHRPNSLIRGCPGDDLHRGDPHAVLPGMR